MLFFHLASVSSINWGVWEVGERFCSGKNVIPVIVPEYDLRVLYGRWPTVSGTEGVFGVVVLVDGCPRVGIS